MKSSPTGVSAMRIVTALALAVAIVGISLTPILARDHEEPAHHGKYYHGRAYYHPVPVYAPPPPPPVVYAPPPPPPGISFVFPITIR